MTMTYLDDVGLGVSGKLLIGCYAACSLLTYLSLVGWASCRTRGLGLQNKQRSDLVEEANLFS